MLPSIQPMRCPVCNRQVEITRTGSADMLESTPCLSISCCNHTVGPFKRSETEKLIRSWNDYAIKRGIAIDNGKEKVDQEKIPEDPTCPECQHKARYKAVSLTSKGPSFYYECPNGHYRTSGHVYDPSIGESANRKIEIEKWNASVNMEEKDVEPVYEKTDEQLLEYIDISAEGHLSCEVKVRDSARFHVHVEEVKFRLKDRAKKLIDLREKEKIIDKICEQSETKTISKILNNLKTVFDKNVDDEQLKKELAYYSVSDEFKSVNLLTDLELVKAMEDSEISKPRLTAVVAAILSRLQARRNEVSRIAKEVHSLRARASVKADTRIVMVDRSNVGTREYESYLTTLDEDGLKKECESVFSMKDFRPMLAKMAGDKLLELRIRKIMKAK